MNDKDKEAFGDFVCQHDQGIVQAGDESELDMAERVWQAACEYKDKELVEWREAARSEADEVNRLQAENKKLREALEKLSFYVSYNGDTWVSEIARKALKEVSER